MIKKIEETKNYTLTVLRSDDNDLYIELYKRVKGVEEKPIAIYAYPSKTIIKNKKYSVKDMKKFIDYLESVENETVEEIMNI